MINRYASAWPRPIDHRLGYGWIMGFAFLAKCSSPTAATDGSVAFDAASEVAHADVLLRSDSQDASIARDAVVGISVMVNPMSISLAPGGSRTFTCTITGSTNTACTWRVTEAAGGTITASGAYSAPSAAGTYHVVATSVADSTATATATVTVVAQVVAGCNQLPSAGTWQDITPPALNMSQWCTPGGTCPGAGQQANGELGTYGTNAFVLDTVNVGTVYLGTSSLGIWKSTDCGSTWVHIDTGQNGTLLDAGRNWTMVIDPIQPNVVYTVAGYGQGGVYKSVNGGVDWAQILPASILNVTAGGFMEKITMEPDNNQHLLASFHADCTGTPLPGTNVDSSGGWGCLAETTDAGGTWTLTTCAIPWTGADGPGQTMIDATTWFYATNGSDGLWRTTTAGVSVGGAPAWTQVYENSIDGSVYVAGSGTYYAGGNNLLWSSDQGLTWDVVSGSPSVDGFNGSTPMVDDGTTLYVGSFDNGGTYWSVPLASPSAPLTMISSTPGASNTNPARQVLPSYFDYDSVHHLIYASNMTGGFWRYVTQ